MALFGGAALSTCTSARLSTGPLNRSNRTCADQVLAAHVGAEHLGAQLLEQLQLVVRVTRCSQCSGNPAMMKASTVCCGSSSRLRKAPRGPVLGNHADDRASDASEVRARARRRRHWRGRRRSRRGSGPRRPLPRSPPEVRFIAIALECYEWRECWAGLVAAPYPPPPRNRMNGRQPLFSQQPDHLATPYNFPRTLQLATRFRRSQTSVVPRTRGSSKPWLRRL